MVKTISAPFERVKMIMQCIDSEVKMKAPEPRASKIVIDVMDSIQEGFDSDMVGYHYLCAHFKLIFSNIFDNERINRLRSSYSSFRSSRSVMLEPILTISGS